MEREVVSSPPPVLQEQLVHESSSTGRDPMIHKTSTYDTDSTKNLLQEPKSNRTASIWVCMSAFTLSIEVSSALKRCFATLMAARLVPGSVSDFKTLSKQSITCTYRKTKNFQTWCINAIIYFILDRSKGPL